MPIQTFDRRKGKGLRRLHEDDDASGIKAEWVDKLRDMLLAIDAAERVEETGLFPGWRLHPMKGDLKGYWSLTITGNWRLLFRFEDGDAFDLHIDDPH
jgi:proteic killer suppression protein